MLASTCSIRRWIEALVKFLSRAFPALNLLPSMAATAWANRPSCRHRAMNWRQVLRIAGPLSFLTLQPAARRDLVDVAVNVDLQQRARMIGGTSGRFWNHTVKAQRPEIQLIDEHVDHPHRVVLSNEVIQILGKQNALYTVFTLNEARHLTPGRESSRIITQIITQQAFSHSLHP